MAESTLSLQKSDFEQAVGDYLGFGRGLAAGDTAWTTAQTNFIQDYVKSGLRKFYYPALSNGQIYEWSFLRPVSTFTLAADANTLELPDDFNGFVGPVLVSGSDRPLTPISLTGRARQMGLDSPDRTGYPLYAEVEAVLGTSATEGSRYRLRVYPKADVEYTLQGQYSIHPDALTGDLPYVYGGTAHHETVLESCLAVAEQRRDDVIGIHTQLFQERLAASIAQDRRLKPEFFGYNADRSEAAYWNWPHRYDGSYPVTFDGITPS